MEIHVMAELVSLACFTLENRTSPSSDEAHRRVRIRTVIRWRRQHLLRCARRRL